MSNKILIPICILTVATLILLSCNNKSESNAMAYPLPTFGLEFDTDSRYGFKDNSVPMPNIEGLSSSYRWAYCHKDSCNTGYYVVGIRCPENKVVRQWVSERLWEEMKGEEYDKIAPKNMVENTSISISVVADFYLDQWQSYYDNFLTSSSVVVW